VLFRESQDQLIGDSWDFMGIASGIEKHFAMENHHSQEVNDQTKSALLKYPMVYCAVTGRDRREPLNSGWLMVRAWVFFY